MILASRHEEGRAYVVVDDHRRGNMQPYLYRVEGFGRRWTRIAGPEQVRGYALSVAEDHKDPDLLFLGTEAGLWVTQTGGKDWWRWTAGLPTTSVKDLAIQEREDDLVIGTHGRAAFVIDNYAPLRALTADSFDQRLALVGTQAGTATFIRQTAGERFPAQTEFRGENPPRGAWIDVIASGDDLTHPDDTKESVRRNGRAGSDAKAPLAKLVITRPSGEAVRTAESNAETGPQ